MAQHAAQHRGAKQGAEPPTCHKLTTVSAHATQQDGVMIAIKKDLREKMGGKSGDTGPGGGAMVG